MRAGGHALSLLSVPLNVHVLRALEEGPKPLADLRRSMGSPPETTMRAHLRGLTRAGVLERRRQAGFPGSVHYEFGTAGRDLLQVASILEAWLEESPEAPARLGTATAKSLIKALVDGWDSTVVRALAAKPLALTELSRVVTGLTYPSLERRLVAMRLAGQIERSATSRRGTPYQVTRWLRQAVAPLAAAARWERSYLPNETEPFKRIDIESIFLLSVPLLRLPNGLEGSCRLAMELRDGVGSRRVAGATVEVSEGRIQSCVSKLDGRATGWAAGSPTRWIGALIDQQADSLEIGGDCDLARELLDGLHRELFRDGRSSLIPHCRAPSLP